MQETHPLRVFPDGGDEHVTSKSQGRQFRLQTDPDRHNIQKPLPLTNDEGPRAYYIVTPDGLEPSTLRLEVTCSIQLSYGAKLV